MDFLPNLRCPVTKNGLDIINKDAFKSYHIPEQFGSFSNLDKGLLDKSRQYFYPIFNDIIILHQQYALFVGRGTDQRSHLSFDKKRVFDYYNQINYQTKDYFNIYQDSSKWVDYREVSGKYLRTSFARASRFYPASGKYLLDIASGPIGLPEYMFLSDGYDFRVCIDVSINALLQAKQNIEKAGKQGIYICGDITNIPLRDNAVDTVLSQHTLYHIPRNDQKTAVNELYRVASPGSKVVIIYSWFYHSWFMNLSLNLVQLYRIARHLAGKLYVKFFPSRPRLYYYAHSPRWFRKSFHFGKDIEFFCWRSTNKYFMKIFIHRKFFGRKILDKLIAVENEHSKFMSTFGEYAAIVITKKE